MCPSRSPGRYYSMHYLGDTVVGALIGLGCARFVHRATSGPSSRASMSDYQFALFGILFLALMKTSTRLATKIRALLGLPSADQIDDATFA